MTDNEIINELQSASEWFKEHGRNTNTAIIGICDRALDLINRKNAEIERLKELIIQGNNEHLSYVARLIEEERERVCIESLNRAKSENEELQRKNTELQHEILNCKSEAIKEFAERLKNIYVLHDGLHSIIDNLVEEMCGKDEGNG